MSLACTQSYIYTLLHFTYIFFAHTHAHTHVYSPPVAMAHLVSYFAEKKNKELAMPKAQLEVKKALSKFGIDDESVPQVTWGRLELPIRAGSASDLCDPALYAEPEPSWGRGHGRVSGSTTPQEALPRHRKSRTVSCSVSPGPENLISDDDDDDDDDNDAYEFNRMDLLRRRHTEALFRFKLNGLDGKKTLFQSADDVSDSDYSSDSGSAKSVGCDVTAVTSTSTTWKHSCPIAALPVELLEAILELVDPQTLGRAAQVCRLWSLIAGSERMQQLPSFSVDIRFSKYRTQQANPDTVAVADDQVNALAVHTTASGEEFLYTAAGSTVLVSNGSSSPVLALKGHSDQVCAICIAPDGRVFTAGFDKTIKGWNPDGTELFSVLGHTGAIRALAVSPCGKFLYSGSHDKLVKIWSIDTEHGGGIPDVPLSTLSGHRSGVYALAVSPCGEKIYSGAGSKDSRIHVWSRTGELIQVLNEHQGGIFALACGPTGRVYSGSVDKTVRIWSSYGSLLRTIRGHRFTIQSLAVDNKNRLFSGSIDTTMRVSDAISGRYIQTLSKHTETVTAIAASSSGRVFSASHDKNVILW